MLKVKQNSSSFEIIITDFPKGFFKMAIKGIDVLEQTTNNQLLGYNTSSNWENRPNQSYL